MSFPNLASSAPDFDTLLTLHLGSERRPYYIHPDVLIQEFLWFRERLSNSSDMPIVVEACTSFDEMTVVVNWCYNKGNALDLPKFDANSNKEEANDFCRAQLMKTYLLAHKLSMSRLKNELVNHFRCCSYGRPMAIDSTRIMLASLRAEHGISRFIIDQLAYHIFKHPQEYASMLDTWSRVATDLIESDITLLCTFTRRHIEFQSTEEVPRSMPACFYHDHVLGFGCPDQTAGIQSKAVSSGRTPAPSKATMITIKPSNRARNATSRTSTKPESSSQQTATARVHRETSKTSSMEVNNGSVDHEEESDSDLSSVQDSDEEQ